MLSEPLARQYAYTHDDDGSCGVLGLVKVKGLGGKLTRSMKGVWGNETDLASRSKSGTKSGTLPGLRVWRSDAPKP